MQQKSYDLLIIGGGASGLACAISAKQKNAKLNVAILEKNDRTAKKLMSTGNGRCNLTNKNVSANKYVGSFKDNLNSILEKYSTDDMLNFFSNLGLVAFCDDEGRYYPVSKHSASVVDVLRYAVERLKIDAFCNVNIKSIKKQNEFTINTDESVYKTKKLVIACGSKASPKLKATSSAYDYLKNFGLNFKPFSPALCPAMVNSKVIKSLKGIRSVAKATLYDNLNKPVKSEYGEVQFNENSLSGICIFNLSLYCKKGDYITLNFLPNNSYEEIRKLIIKQKTLFSDFSVDKLLTGIFHKTLACAILRQSGISDLSRKAKTLSSNETESICKTIHKMKFDVIKNEGFDKAQCCLGGLIASEINPLTMETKKIKNLFVCGEAVDICGECGGYNLHFAFASGRLIGDNL